jgi:uncharacterized protein
MGGMTENYVPGTPNWIDLGTTDVPGAIRFYGGLFGWEHADFGPEAGGYGAFLKDGKQVAGVGPATDPARGTSWATYFATDDADGLAERVRAGGGQVIVPPGDVMEQGRFAVFTDPAGAYFSAWQPAKHGGAELMRAPGSLTWVELLTPDSETAKPFYAAALGVQIRDVPMGEGPTYTLLVVDGSSVAGLMQLNPAWGNPPGWSLYFEVEDCDAAYAKALELGAASTGEPQDSPPGRFAGLADPQGGRFSIIKSDPAFSM